MKYNHQKIEKKWAKVWQEEKIYEPNLKNPLGRSSGKKNFYNLMMFPYPSAEGLHVCNMYAFTGSDIHGRFKRMRDYNVFEPIGLDGFGIHSENYALKINVHPKKQSKISEKRFYKQLESIGNGFSWDERLETYDQEYYRWTQWIFTQLFNRGLAYRKKQAVNWCLSCQTVLADEQVISGECERCSNQVIQKELEQWFFKITTYAEKLLKNLDQLDWSERVKIAQKNWIGKSEGSLIKFKVKSEKLNVEEDLEVFTTRPDTLFGATYVVIAPEHELIASLLQTTIPSVILSEAKDLLKIKNFEEVKKYIEETKAKTEIERTNETKEKTGVELLGIKAINPANQELLPIFVSDYVLGGVGTGAIMAVPAHDQRDYDFAKKFNLPIKIVICPNYPAVTCPILESAYTGQGHLVASGQFDGLESERAKEQITKFVGGVKKTKYRLRDWLISRQRYWGPPIPMIFCESCAEETKNEKLKTKSKTGNKKNFNLGELENPGWFAVSEKDLPVELPNLKNFRPQGTGESPLASLKSFSETKCPKCQRKAKRETDVSDNFLDSTWYFFRYLDSSNQKQIFDQKLI
ncbi:leucine--tRNA ligase, partial [Candidatus Azambacteria bacterium]|nr:leucine--tRNA ligase [Candidatus Azambacteria bacterium]